MTFFNHHWLQVRLNKRTDGLSLKVNSSHHVLLSGWYLDAHLGHPYVHVIIESSISIICFCNKIRCYFCNICYWYSERYSYCSSTCYKTYPNKLDFLSIVATANFFKPPIFKENIHSQFVGRWCKNIINYICNRQAKHTMSVCGILD